MLNKSLALLLIAAVSPATPVYIKKVTDFTEITRGPISVNVLDSSLGVDHVAGVVGSGLEIGNPGDPRSQVGQVAGDMAVAIGRGVVGQLDGSDLGGTLWFFATAEEGVSGLTRSGISHDL